MTRIIYVVYTKEYLTSRQIIGANLKKYAFLCDYSEVKIDDLIDSPMYSTPMQAECPKCGTYNPEGYICIECKYDNSSGI